MSLPFLLQTLKQLDAFKCRPVHGVTCLSSAQKGPQRILLVGSNDGSVSTRDALSGSQLWWMQSHLMAILCLEVLLLDSHIDPLS